VIDLKLNIYKNSHIFNCQKIDFFDQVLIKDFLLFTHHSFSIFIFLCDFHLFDLFSQVLTIFFRYSLLLVYLSFSNLKNPYLSSVHILLVLYHFEAGLCSLSFLGWVCLLLLFTSICFESSV
jgi:hypothetical protein